MSRYLWVANLSAAAIIIGLTIAVWFFTEPRKDEVLQIEMHPHPQIAPRPGPPAYLWEFERAQEMWDRDHI